MLVWRTTDDASESVKEKNAYVRAYVQRTELFFFFFFEECSSLCSYVKFAMRQLYIQLTPQTINTHY